MVGELLSIAKRVVKAAAEPFVWPLQHLRGIAAGEPLFAALLLVVLLVCAVRAVGGGRFAALLLVPLSFAWVLFNGPLEGPTLFVLSQSHGVTVSDLISVVCLFVASWRLAPVLLRR